MNKILSIGLVGGVLLAGCSTTSDKLKDSCADNPQLPKCIASSPVTASSDSSESQDMMNGVESDEAKIVGGWAPTFFSWFDTKQLNNIVEGMSEGRISRVVISYPSKMQTLANKIQNYLQSDTNQKVEMHSIELKDTDQVSYNLTQVIVTLYFK